VSKLRLVAAPVPTAIADSCATGMMIPPPHRSASRAALRTIAERSIARRRRKEGPQVQSLIQPLVRAHPSSTNIPDES